MSRLNQILSITFAVQLALAAFIFWWQSASSEVASGPALPDYAADQVTQLTLSDGEGNQLTLAKNDEAWLLPDADDYPVDDTKVYPLLEKLEELETNRRVTTTDASHGRLQVADSKFNRKVELTLADGGTETLFLGSASGASATHFRLNGDSNVYLTGALTAWEANTSASGWVDTLYVTIPTTTVTKITLDNPNGTLEFSREADGQPWSLAGVAPTETFDESQMTALLNQVTSIRLTEPLGTTAQADYGLDRPSTTVTVAAEQTYTLELGVTDAEGNYFAKASGSPYYVTIAQFTGNSLSEKTRDDYLADPPQTPTQ